MNAIEPIGSRQTAILIVPGMGSDHCAIPIPIAAVGLLHPMISVSAITASSLLLKRAPLSAIRKTH